MKKIVIGALLCTISLTGCQSTNSNLLSYQNVSSQVSDSIGRYVTPAAADFLSQKLCVITKQENTMTAPEITAESALTINDTTNQTVYAQNVYAKVYPASTTKLMTALLALKYGNLKDEVTIKEDNCGITIPGAMLCKFKKGDVVTMETLLYCLLVFSGNDAGIAIAEHMYGSEEAFVEKMNEEAALIGATSSHFVNSHGLHDPNHYTTAYDMYLIMKECLKYDKFLSIVGTKEYQASITQADGTVRNPSFKTTNMFLLGTRETPEGVTILGGKSGSTGDAGDCYVLYSKNEAGEAFISAVFKAKGKTSLYDQLSYLVSLK